MSLDRNRIGGPSDRQRVGEIIDRYERGWQAGGRPVLSQFWSTLGQELASLPKEAGARLALELALVDMEYRWCNRGDAATAILGESDTASGGSSAVIRLEEYTEFLRSTGLIDDLPAELVAQEYRLRWKTGERPEIAEYLRQYPALQPRLVPLLQEARQAAQAFAGDKTSGSRPLPRRLDKFELQQILGQGAFGTVYRARDVELDRTVALKVPRQAMLESREDEERFMREARSSAQLNHPGIVQVFDVGRSGEQIFIVAEFVDGPTLNQAAADRRFSFRDVAELTAATADALHHAHERGVVHRDLKPSNVLLERIPGSPGSAEEKRPPVVDAAARLAPRITDFGLARRDMGEATFTREGDILGTPAYMSPEQAKGDAYCADRRSDVYSLGVILFELLTGERPFRGNAQMLLQQVIHDDPPAARRLAAEVPRDLDTIALKALAKEPDRRYATAAEMAADLRRWLRGEPIQARPIGRLERGVRWCRRNPWPASFLLLAVVSLLVITAGSVFAAVRMNRAREEAEFGLRQANQAVDDFFTRVSEYHLIDQPGFEPLRRELLGLALDYYQRFLRERRDAPAYRIAVAQAHLRVGKIKETLEGTEQALASYHRALEILNSLHRVTPDDRDIVLALAQTHNNLGYNSQGAGNDDVAEQHYRSAEKVLLAFDGLNNDVDLRRQLGINQIYQAQAAQRQGNHQRAAELYASVLRQRESLSQQFPDIPLLKEDLASAYRGIGDFLESSSLALPDVDLTAEDAYRQAIEIMQRITERDPRRLRARYALGSYLADLGWLLRESSLEDAIEALQQALSLQETLVRESPQVLDYVAATATTLDNLGYFTQQLAQASDERQQLLAESLAYYRRAETYCDQLIAQDRENLAHPALKSQVLNGIALTQRDLGQYELAAEGFERALEVQQGLIARNPDRVSFRRDYAGTLNNIGRLAQQRGDQVAAAKWFRQAADAMRSVAQESPTDMVSWNYLRMMLVGLSNELQALGDAEAVIEVLVERIEVGERLLAVDDRRSRRDELAEAYSVLAGTLVTQGQPEKAVDAGRKAVDLRRQLLEQSGAAGDATLFAAASNNLGLALEGRGDTQDALAAFGEGLARAQPFAGGEAATPLHAEIAKILLGRAAVWNRLNEHLRAADDLKAAANLGGSDPQAGDLEIVARNQLCRTLALAGLEQETLREIAALAGRDDVPRVLHYSFAGCLGILCRHLAQDAELEPAERDKQIRQHAGKALQYLRIALRDLQQDPVLRDQLRLAERLDSDPDFEALRDSDAFQELLREFAGEPPDAANPPPPGVTNETGQ